MARMGKYIVKGILAFVCGVLGAVLFNHFCNCFMSINFMTKNSDVNFETQLNRFCNDITYNFFGLDSRYYLYTILVFVGIIFLFFFVTKNYKEKVRKQGLNSNAYGSARWATDKEMEEFKSKKFEENFILSENAAMSIPAIKQRGTLGKLFLGKGQVDRNKHILVVGGSGSGKTFNVVGPNLLQAQYSYISTDPKGDTVAKYGRYLLNKGYKLKIINTKDTESFPYSFKYNPFEYIADQASIMNLVSIIIENTSGSDNAQAKEDFWVKSERCLYMCLIAYIHYIGDGKIIKKNIPTLLDLIGEASASEQNEDAKSVLDCRMEQLKENLIKEYGSEAVARRKPEWFILTQYDGFKKAAGETAKSIIISCFVRLSPFAIGVVRDMFSEDELELEKLGEEKTAIFFVMSDTDSTFNFIMAMIFYQLFDINVRKADSMPGSHCKIPVMCILDEMANIGRIPDLEIKIATLRSRWINLVPILQNTAQLDSLYGKEKAVTIKANCDTLLYLGRADFATCEEISKQLGKETVEVKSTSKSRTGSSTSTQKIARDLLMPDEISSNPQKFAPDECLSIIKMAYPYKDKKYMLFNHPAHTELEAAGMLDVKQYVVDYRKRKAEQKAKEAKIEKQVDEEILKEDGYNAEDVEIANEFLTCFDNCVFDNTFYIDGEEFCTEEAA